MEKISFQASYTRISIYAQSSTSALAKKAAGVPSEADLPSQSADGKDGPGTAGPCQKNKDGDTFTLSIEAQSVMISGTLIRDDAYGPEKAGSDRRLRAASENKGGDAAREAASEFLEGLDLPSDFRLVNAFLDAMEKAEGKVEGRGRHARGPQIPELSNPQDVADTLLRQLGTEHSQKGGSRSGFADEFRRRLADWESSASRVSVEYREFRSEVRMKTVSALEAWVASDSATG